MIKLLICILSMFGSVALGQAQQNGSQLQFLNGGLPVLDAHNCYPYKGNFGDRIDRALSTGYPIGIEQDLAWFVDPATQTGRIVVSHTPQPDGMEPTLEKYFFDRVRPAIEQELKNGDQSRWPLIVLHFDFKDNQVPLLRAVWDLLGKYDKQGWLSTARKTDDGQHLSPLERKPILVLTEENDTQEQVFFRDVPTGSRLLLFGSVQTTKVEGANQAERIQNLVRMRPEKLFPGKPTNYRRWWNGSWYAVEEGGAPGAGEWTAADQQRLQSLVQYAHRQGLWIRFYTLDGFLPADDHGWGRGYNFGSAKAAQLRWAAAIKAGVNLIATDQYEDFAAFRKQVP